jgi:phosphatidylserine/phosphatidylglycerophosphate/cardiolipin synthase-like enzyme
VPARPARASREVDVDESRAGESRSVWRFEHASRAHVIVDAQAYFTIIRDAMCKAERRIFLIGWDFDTRLRLSGGRRWWQLRDRGRFPARLGDFILWLSKAKPGLEIVLLQWRFALFKFLFRGSMIFDLVRWALKPRIDFKFDSAHPVGCSHHQKIVVIDDHVAVCGGIDMTSACWDTRAHLHEDPRRRTPRGRPYGPWHDVTMIMEGDVARALGELGRARWEVACGKTLDPCDPPRETSWPDSLTAEFRDVEIGIARTRAPYRDNGEVYEIEELFLEHIARARRFVYAETQYFASRRIAEAIAERLQEPDPPEFVIINPLTSDGWLEQTAMDTARARLVYALTQVDPAGRFRIFVPYTTGRDPIYVHAKLTIVDDEVLRVGSANMNNRSMGLDSECDVFLDAARPGNAHASDGIARLRHSLLAEHCGIDPEEVRDLLERYGSMAATIDSLPRQGKHLAPFVLRELSDAEKALADSALLDPERPMELFEPIGKRGLFRRHGILRKPREALRRMERRSRR